jgi:hypothetical protein
MLRSAAVMASIWASITGRSSACTVLIQAPGRP